MGDRYLWIDPTGDAHTLPTIDPKAGGGMPPVSVITEATIGADGSRVINVRHDERTVDLAVAFRPSLHDDADGIRDELRTLAAALDPKAGDGKLRRIRPDGTTRELIARYRGGLELDERDPAWVMAVLTFLAPDPYWRDVADTSLVFTQGVEGTTFLPGPPFELVSPTLWGDATVANVGQVDAWPRWVITGPATGITLTNVTTGQHLTLSTVLAAGETLTVDTRPGAKSIVDDTGANRFGDVVAGSRIWPLTPGTNSLTISIPGATDDSKVALGYRPRYLTA